MTLNEQPAATLARKLAAREITREALAQACLERVHARECNVLAWTHIDAAAVLGVARELDRSVPRGLLWGLPVGVQLIGPRRGDRRLLAIAEFAFRLFPSTDPASLQRCIGTGRRRRTHWFSYFYA